MIINKKNKQLKLKKVLKIIIPIVLIIILLLAISKTIEKRQKEKEKQMVKQYTSVDQFETIEQVAMYLDCEYIKEEKSKTEGYTTDIYLNIKVNTFSGEKSNKIFYERLFQYCAEVLNHNNFVIIDQSKELVIGVVCNKDTNLITNYYINGKVNYFQDYVSQKQIQEFTRVGETELNVKSPKLKKVITNAWSVSDTIFGTKDSTYNNYNIYFDEGIEVKKVNGKILNIVFTDKYEEEVLQGITTKSSQDEIKQILGEPQLQLQNIIGYKSEDIYIFFSENEISVYRVEENYNTQEFVQAISQFNQDNNLINFINAIKKAWPDYDIYKYDNDYVYLQYSLKGINIQYNYNDNNGIFIYNNFYGNVSESTTIEQIVENGQSTPQNLYIKNENLVFNAEIKRIEEQNEISYENTNIIEGKSQVFDVSTENSGNGTYKVKFVSKTTQYPNRELKENIISAKWIDDTTFAYINGNETQYEFNLKTGKYIKK